MLVLSADAALTPAFVHSYLRLGVLAEPTADGYRERPLDQRRLGFMLSEMGVAVLLRRLPRGQTPAPGDTELLDTATACEATDLLRPSDHMDALRYVAGRLFASAKAHGRRVDVLHPHAPGTPDHDPRELSALLQTLSSPHGPGTHGSPPVGLYACKGALGHALGASGLASLVLALLALRTGKLPPMPWLDQPIDLHGAAASQHPMACDDAGTHAVFAAGFGGHTAGALLHRRPGA
jgi:3-oxoacyl-[acyl-carrier-protein] synthase II